MTLVGAQQVWGTPKGHERRDVPIPRFLVDQLAEHVSGKALPTHIFRRAAFDRAAEVIGIPGLHPHELRHTAASLAIAADVKVVQKMLGHKSATMTLDQYGHLFDDRLDDVADRLDLAAESFVSLNRPAQRQRAVASDLTRGIRLICAGEWRRSVAHMGLMWAMASGPARGG